jgi:DNA-binding NarL/FixJ family response regulator
MPTLAILEDSTVPLQQMKQALQSMPQYQLVYNCQQGSEMKTWLNMNTVDALVADLGLPDMSGIEVIAHCKHVQPNTEIMVCTVFEDDDHLFKSLKSGANAYLLKSDIEQKFLSSLIELLEGGSPMSPNIARRVLRELDQPASKQSSATNDKAERKILSPKELDILNLLMRGFKYAEIARIQSCTVHTVNTHIKSIYKKLQVTSATEAVFEALNMNLFINN